MTESNGALTEAVYYILISTYTQLHGYGIMQKIETMSNGRVKLGAGTLYGAISTLLKKEWIIEVENETSSRKKEYRITKLGREAVENEMNRLKELIGNGKAVLEEHSNEEL